MIPFYAFYSMFGFQRVGDLAWAAGDIQARGFLLGGTAGRTTLAGEGLQHDDGSSHVLSAQIPNCVSYDPTYAYEMAVIIHDGLERMYTKNESVFYYIMMNENYTHPEMPKGAREGIVKGMYLLHEAKRPAREKVERVQLMGRARSCAKLLPLPRCCERTSVYADVWSATSTSTREAQAVERWNMLHPQEAPKVSYVQKCLQGHGGPVTQLRTTFGCTPSRFDLLCPIVTPFSAQTATATVICVQHFAISLKLTDATSPWQHSNL